MSFADSFNYSLIPIFNNNGNNVWINPYNEEEKLFSLPKLEGSYYLTLTKSSLTSFNDTFMVSNNVVSFIPEKSFYIDNIKIRLNSNLYNYFILTYISVYTNQNVYKKFIVKPVPDEKYYYYIKFDNRVKVNTDTSFLDLIKFTIEPMRFDENKGFEQFAIYENLKNVELITVEFSGRYSNPNEEEEEEETASDKFSNKNILENLLDYRINILEYQRKISIFENNQTPNKANQISIFNIKCVNYSYITMNIYRELNINMEVPAKVRTYTLGRGVLYNVYITSNKNSNPFYIKEIKTCGGEFTTYKTKNSMEKIQTFYVDADPNYQDLLPNKKSKRIYIISDYDILNDNLLSNLIFQDSNPIVF